MINLFLNKLIDSKKSIYCAVRLFSPQDRISGANIAGAIEVMLNEAVDNASEYVFLPYRDTNQSSIINSDRAKQIYELDIIKLKNSSALLARFDGIAKDSGIAMEIGYAYGLGIPIGVLLTDFIWEGLDITEDSWSVDPIIASMADCIVSSPDFKGIKSSYYQSNLEHEFLSVKGFINTCFEKFASRPANANRRQNNGSIYIDFMGGRYEWAKIMMQDIVASLLENNIVCPIYMPERYMQSNKRDIEEKALSDIEAAANSNIAVFCGDAPELDAGSAALLGYAKANNIYVIYQYSSPVLCKGSGGQKMKGNLMLEQAADIVTNSLDTTISAIMNRIG